MFVARSTAPGASAPGATSTRFACQRSSSRDSASPTGESGRPDPGLDGEKRRQDGGDLGSLWAACRRNHLGAWNDGEGRASQIEDILFGSTEGDRPGCAISCVDLGLCSTWDHRKRCEGEDSDSRRVGYRPRSVENSAVDGAPYRDEPVQGFDFPWVQVAAPGAHVDGLV